MRIVHISTSRTGGAGIVAGRLSEIQQEAGHDSCVLARAETLTLSQRILSKANTFFSLKSSSNKYHQITPTSFSVFDFVELQRINPDIVYIHNWFNFLNFEDLKKITNMYNTIFVLHDERLLTGGCHVTLGCNSYLESCKKCPASKIPGIISRSKSHLSDCIEGFGDFGVVTPSNWLKSRLDKALLGTKAKISTVIPNPTPRAFSESRSSKNYKTETAHALFVSNDVLIPYKGFNLLMDSIKGLNLKDTKYSKVEITVLGASGYKDESLSNGVCVQYKPAVSQTEMHDLFSQSQFLLLPSASENHPGVINEAQLSGVIVVATDVGGIPEMVRDGETGFLSEHSPMSFQKTFKRALGSNILENISYEADIQARKRTNTHQIEEMHNAVMQGLINA